MGPKGISQLKNIDAADGKSGRSWVHLLGRVFMSLGDDSFIPAGTTLTCTDVSDLVQLSYENRRLGVISGSVDIRVDGTAVLRHRLNGSLRMARGWLAIHGRGDEVRLDGEWLSSKNDAWGSLELLELKLISAP